MNRSEKVCNKLVQARVQKKKLRTLRKRLKKVSGMVDTAPPASYGLSHLRKNLKKAQMLEDKYQRIEHQNRTLLQRMSDIMENPSRTTDSRRTKGQHIKSLNIRRRRENLDRITNDNSHLIGRLRNMKPYYKVDEWEEDHKKQHKIMKEIMEHDYIGKDPSGHRRKRYVSAGGSGASAARSARQRQRASSSRGKRRGSRSARSTSRNGARQAWTPPASSTRRKPRSVSTTASRAHHPRSSKPGRSRRPHAERAEPQDVDDDVVELFRFPSLALRGVGDFPDSAWDVSLFDSRGDGGRRGAPSVLVLRGNKVSVVGPRRPRCLLAMPNCASSCSNARR